MADEADDVLELEDELAPEADEGEEQGEAVEGEGADSQDDEEDLIAFGDEEAAPASEDQTSTVRHLREKLREAQREAAELRKVTAKPKVELGPKPTLAEVDYDEDRYEQALDDWKSRKAQIEREEQAEQEQAKKASEEWAGRVQTYQSGKTQLRVPDFDAAEATVFTALPEQHQALLMMAKNPAALVYALSKSPSKLDELSKLDLTRAAMMVGKLEDKVSIQKRKPSAQPDTPLRGNAAVSGGEDREEARLAKEAEKTGDRTKLIAYRRQKRAK
ncbi:hypothetical protein [Novosphingobium sp. M1R2S20]|uniref:Scaffolding protein n=1 Tax=Novosphingobium rhizovicinum TaxID=3228928 RepID=A0ABV3RD91_9SPHN